MGRSVRVRAARIAAAVTAVVVVASVVLVLVESDEGAVVEPSLSVTGAETLVAVTFVPVLFVVAFLLAFWALRSPAPRRRER